MQRKRMKRAVLTAATAAAAAAMGFSPSARAESVFMSSMELLTEVDTAHTGTWVSQTWTWGDSFDQGDKIVDHARSPLHATDGNFSLHAYDPNGGFSWGTEYYMNGYDDPTNPNHTQGDSTVNKIKTTTKLLLDFTTVPGPAGYASLFGAINYAGGFLDSYNPSGLGKNYGVVGSPVNQTTPLTQTYTWDFGPQMVLGTGSIWGNMGASRFIKFHIANNAPAGVAVDFFYDNFRWVDENTAIHPTWQAGGTGDWMAPASWANVPNGVPNGVGARAIFYGAGDGNVTLNSNATLGALILDAQVTSYQHIADASPPPIVNYTVAGTGAIDFDAAAGATGEIFVIAGNHNINVPVTFSDNLRIDTSAGFGPDSGAPINPNPNPPPPNLGRTSTVPVTSLGFGGPVNLAAGVTLTTSGAGSVSFNGVVSGGAGSAVNVRGGSATFGGNVTAGALNVSGNAKATVAAGGNKTVVVNALTIAAGGRLDMTDNDFIVDYASGDPSPEVALRDHVKAIYLGGTSGIAYTPGAGDVAIAVAERSEWGFSEFNGVALDTTAVVGKYTYFGDANLDGKVTSDDYVAVDVGLGTGDSWVQGDFNFSGTVTSDDYVAIDVNLGKGTPTPLAWAELKAEMIALHTEMFGEEYVQMLAQVEAEGFAALVPEPGAMSLLAIGAAAVLRRRRRN